MAVDMEWSHVCTKIGLQLLSACPSQVYLSFFLQRMRSFTFPKYKLMLSLIDFWHVNILKYQPAYTMSMNGNECVFMDG